MISHKAPNRTFGKDTRTIDWVVEAELCTRCGACGGVCPVDAIVWDHDFLPRVIDGCTLCGLCVRVCGGIEVDFRRYGRQIYGAEQDFVSDAVQPYRFTEVAHTADSELRQRSSSGGLVSQMLITLLGNGEIDGVVVVVHSKGDALTPTAMIARTAQEVRAAVQSKYMLFPVAHIYKEIIDCPGRYAVVGLPCQLHSLRRWQDISTILRKRVVLTIGLCCQANLERRMIEDLLAVKGIVPRSVRSLDYRGGPWPGSIRVQLDDGIPIPLHSCGIKDGAFTYLKSLYVAKRCLLCTDYSAELADLSVADPWIRGTDGEYRFQEGWSLVHVRTSNGEAYYKRLRAGEEITALSVSDAAIVRKGRRATRVKKRETFVRLAVRKAMGLPYPAYHLSPPVLTLADYFKTAWSYAQHVGLYAPWLRKTLLFLMFSPAGERLKQLRARYWTLKVRLDLRRRNDT